MRDVGRHVVGRARSASLTRRFTAWHTQAFSRYSRLVANIARRPTVYLLCGFVVGQDHLRTRFRASGLGEALDRRVGLRTSRSTWDRLSGGSLRGPGKGSRRPVGRTVGRVGTGGEGGGAGRAVLGQGGP